MPRSSTERFADLPRAINKVGLVRGGPLARFGFLLVPGYTAIGYTCGVESLRMANMAAGRPVFEALTLTLDGVPVASSNGVQIIPDCSIVNAPSLDVVLVCGPNPIIFPHQRLLVRWLHRLVEQGATLGGICTGSYLLARAGLLDGYRCTIHWQDYEHLRKDFPKLIISSHIFEIDRDRLTCSGGVASMDMMLSLLSERYADSVDIALACDLLLCDRMRDSRDRQHVPLRHRVGPQQSKLSEAVAIMEANVEEPLSVEELAAHLGLSSRQLERLFRDNLDFSPMQYYMRVRLASARRLLLTTDASILDVAGQCGFTSPSHFTRRYTQRFGLLPGADRRVAVRPGQR